MIKIYLPLLSPFFAKIKPAFLSLDHRISINRHPAHDILKLTISVGAPPMSMPVHITQTSAPSTRNDDVSIRRWHIFIFLFFCHTLTVRLFRPVFSPFFAKLKLIFAPLNFLAKAKFDTTQRGDMVASVIGFRSRFKIPPDQPGDPKIFTGDNRGNGDFSVRFLISRRF